MKQTIKIKRSTVAGREPSNLTAGELAVNLADKKLYTADTNGNTIPLIDSRVKCFDVAGSMDGETFVFDFGTTKFSDIEATFANYDRVLLKIDMYPSFPTVLYLEGYQTTQFEVDEITYLFKGNISFFNTNFLLIALDEGENDSITTRVILNDGCVTQSEFTEGLAGKQNILTFDSAPTANSYNPVESNGIYTALAAKQNKLSGVTVIGSLYRNNVSGTGNISINGTKGQFPTVTTAGTYTVRTEMSSTTNSYGLSVSFGGNNYTLNTTNGTISDSRELTIPANSTWSAAVVGSVASGTILSVKVEQVVTDVTTLGTVAITNSYTDLEDTPTIPTKVSQLTNDSGYTTNIGTITGITMNGTSKGTSGVVNLGTVITSHQDISGKEDKTNKVTSMSSSSTDTQYPSAKAVYDSIESVNATIEENEEITAAALTNLNSAIANKQDTLVSGTNIKTINNTSLLGSGNIAIQGNVQSDWSATSGNAQILNKPQITNVDVGSVVYGTRINGLAGEYINLVGGITISNNTYDNANIRLGYHGGNEDDTITLTSSGSDGNIYLNATDGAKAYYNNKEIAVKDDILQSDWNQTTTTAKDYIKNKPTIPSVAALTTNEIDTIWNSIMS